MTARSCDDEPRIDDEVLTRASRGDEVAFRALYVRHRRDVVAAVTRLVGTGPEREDVLQDAFLQIYRALPSFRGSSSLATYLRRIATNVAMDHLRRRSRHQRIEYNSDAIETAIGTGQDPEQHSGARQQLQLLLRHLDDIAQDKRRALLLVAIAGCSLNDAAERMGANAGWVKKRIGRARRELTAMAVRTQPVRRARRIDAPAGPAAKTRRPISSFDD